jgi:hypothetical protein
MSKFKGIYPKDMNMTVFPSSITTPFAQIKEKNALTKKKFNALTYLSAQNKSLQPPQNTSTFTNDTVIESLKGLFDVTKIDIYINNGLPVKVEAGKQVIGRGFLGFGNKLTKPLIGKIKSYNHTNQTVTIISCDKNSREKDGKEIKISDVTFPRTKEDIDKLFVECNKVSGGTRKRKQCKSRKHNKRTRRN